MDSAQLDHSGLVFFLTIKRRVVTVVTLLVLILRGESFLGLSIGYTNGFDFLGKLIKLILNNTYALRHMFGIILSSSVYLRGTRWLVALLLTTPIIQ